MKVHFGTGIGRRGAIRLAVAAALVANERVLLIKRSDSGDWALPSGGVDPGESVEQGCLRELKEETNLDGRVTGLVGVFSSPDYLIEYADGELVHAVAVVLRVEDLSTSPLQRRTRETSDAQWWDADGVSRLNLNPLHSGRIKAALNPDAHPIIC